ncbi:signal transduction histidine kinase/DNA-binding response OmpR family regulator/HPt (histidine-containing phosphotransfer) domain-containing protein [Azospirillum agricola]|uniref:response regulator n=1 Tax=Azospirillum agricola TaxID=1720247 RepID=UPI002D7FF6BE|nr:response regulator [Azospirillum agricola]MBP2229724.1 signal transduction histidine kinase/DNA-binding response OmpR family regulator/HPt (histidine-containing phosphotransfer) domain-containing protein [Azospirillum agricola]
MAFRILAGLTVIGGLAAATSVVAVSLFSRFHQGFQQVATAKVPGLVAASQLAQQSGTVAAIAPALVAVQDQPAREAVMARLGDQIVMLEELMARLAARGEGLGDLTELERRKNELVANLLTLNVQVERQLAQTADTDARALALAGLAARLRATEALTEDGAVPPADHAAIHRWQRDAGEALTILLAALRAGHEAQLDRLRADTGVRLDRAAAALALLPPDRAAPLAALQDALSAAAFGPDPLFAARAAELSLQRAVKGAAARNQTVSDRLVASVSDYFLAVERDVARRSSEFERVIQDGERAVIAMALLSILGAAAIFVYIHRNVVRRLRALQAAMVAYQTGSPVAIPTQGRDEIGEMARALAYFVGTIRARESALSDSERRLRAILEQSPVGVSIGRTDGSVAFANARAAELAGLDLGAFVGSRHALALPGATIHGRRPAAAGAESAPGPAGGSDGDVVARDVEVAVDRPDGRRVWALQTLQRTEFEGKPAVLAWSYDITERKRAEEALRAAKEQAEVAARSKSEFLATMSHEIRTPMNGVLGLLELIALTSLDAEQRTLVTTMRESAGSLLRIIDDILDLSKIEAGKLELEEQDLRPAELVEGVADLLAPQAHHKNLALVCDIDGSVPPLLRGDAGRLRQVLFNLTGNAIKFTDRGRVVLRVHAAGPAVPGPSLGRVRLHVSVEDTGIGIGAEGQARLFQPFSQADSSTTRRFGGTGLGLAICTRLVERMGGRIGVDSVPGHGSTFWFTVELARAGEAGPDGVATALAGLSVLVADADDTQRGVLARYLAHAGAAVAETGDGDEASALLRAGGADLLVTTTAMAGRVTAPDDRATPPLLLVGGGPAGPHSPPPPPAPWPVVTGLTQPVHRSALIAAAARLLGRGAAVPPANSGPNPGPSPGMSGDAPTPHPLAGPGRPEHGTILVAEDHPTNRQVVLRQLRQLGFEAELAEDGAVALAAWRGGGHRLLITDCHMPRMDGYELARRIREAEAGGESRIPIIAMTANALSGERERCVAAGMDDYLAKPVTLAHLSAALSRWLGDPPPRSAAVPSGPVSLPAPPQSSSSGSSSSGSSSPESPPSDPPPDLPPDLPVLDLDHVRETFGSLDAGTADMMDFFLETTRPTLDQALAALAAGDPEAARAAAHSAAGAARTAGAKALAAHCSALENAILANRLEEAQRQAAAMDAAYPAVEAAVRALRCAKEGVA